MRNPIVKAMLIVFFLAIGTGATHAQTDEGTTCLPADVVETIGTAESFDEAVSLYNAVFETGTYTAGGSTEAFTVTPPALALGTFGSAVPETGVANIAHGVVWFVYEPTEMPDGGRVMTLCADAISFSAQAVVVPGITPEQLEEITSENMDSRFVVGNTISDLNFLFESGLGAFGDEWSALEEDATEVITVPARAVLWTDFLEVGIPANVHTIVVQGNWGVFLTIEEIVIPTPNGGGRWIQMVEESFEAEAATAEDQFVVENPFPNEQGVNVRSSVGVSNENLLGSLADGTIVTKIGEEADGSDTWFEIELENGETGWIAYEYRGQLFLQPVTEETEAEAEAEAETEATASEAPADCVLERFLQDVQTVEGFNAFFEETGYSFGGQLTAGEQYPAGVVLLADGGVSLQNESGTAANGGRWMYYCTQG